MSGIERLTNKPPLPENPDHLYAVYTPGKAATTTTHRTLAAHLDEPIYDIRRASDEGIAEFLAFVEKSKRPLRTDDKEFAAVRAAHPDTHLRLASLTREPVAAAVSSWFFNFSILNPGVDIASWPLDDHRQAIIEGQFASRPDFFTAWFDFECKPFTDIDVYDRPFNIDAGYQMYESPKASLLVVRSESLNKVFHQAFMDFVQIDVPELVNHHVGDTSDYGDVYREFKASANFPRSFVDQQHDTKYAQNFYSADELEAARAQWTASPSSS